MLIVSVFVQQEPAAWHELRGPAADRSRRVAQVGGDEPRVDEIGRPDGERNGGRVVGQVGHVTLPPARCASVMNASERSMPYRPQRPQHVGDEAGGVARPAADVHGEIGPAQVPPRVGTAATTRRTPRTAPAAGARLRRCRRTGTEAVVSRLLAVQSHPHLPGAGRRRAAPLPDAPGAPPSIAAARGPSVRCWHAVGAAGNVAVATVS